MNLSPTWASVLELGGFEAKHWSNIGEAGAPDSAIMEWAYENGFIVLTHDLDYGRLLSLSHADGPSVVQLRTQNIMPSVCGELVMKTINAFADELKTGLLISIDPHQARARVLPLQWP